MSFVRIWTNIRAESSPLRNFESPGNEKTHAHSPWKWMWRGHQNVAEQSSSSTMRISSAAHVCVSDCHSVTPVSCTSPCLGLGIVIPHIGSGVIPWLALPNSTITITSVRQRFEYASFGMCHLRSLNYQAKRSNYLGIIEGCLPRPRLTQSPWKRANHSNSDTTMSRTTLVILLQTLEIEEITNHY